MPGLNWGMPSPTDISVPPNAEPSANYSSSTAADPEREWRDKLFGECQDEFYETFGQYDEDFLHDEADCEDFGDWAERIRREYVTKQHARAQREVAVGSKGRKRRKTKEEAEEEERGRRELQGRLQREHAEYLARAARKEAETRLNKRQQYEEKCAATFCNKSASRLGYADIPWPAPRGSVEEMAEVMLHGADRTDLPTFRKLLRRQQTLWHPDKFAQRCGARLEEGERKRILETVTALSQELNRLAQSLR